MRLKDKVAIITGGSRGIGYATVEKFLKEGATVILTASSQGSADKAVAQLKEKYPDATVAGISPNLSNLESVRNAFREAASKYGCIDILVNNAGIRRDNLMLWMEQDEWSRVLDISLNGFFNVTQPLLKNMLVKRFGRIINIVSLSGIKGMPGQTNYSAAKGGMIAATKALAQEVARKHVTVNAVAPGFIRTDMTNGIDENEWKKQIPAGRFGEPGEVAALVGFLASEQASYITGEVISINGGIYT